MSGELDRRVRTDTALIPGAFDRRAVARAVGALDPQRDAAHAPTWAELLDLAADAVAL